MKVTPNPKLLDSHFLLYFFKSNPGQHELLQHESQVGVPSISNPLTSLKSVSLKLPAIAEQKAITAVLGSLDDKIDLLRRQNKTLEAMAETLFRQWFVEEADKNWEEVSLGDVVEINRSSIDRNYQHSFIQYLDTGSLTEGRIESFQLLSLSEAPSRAKRLVQHNDVLISTVRPDQKHYGIIKNPVENVVVSTGFCVLTCTKIDPHFVYLLLTSGEMTEYLHTIAEGSTSTYPSLKPSDIGSIVFQRPPNVRLKQFADIARNSWEKIAKNNIQIHTLEKLRDTLLPKLMSGEVRVALAESDTRNLAYG
jgi:type I restriction enzyme S subunit